VFFDFSNYTTNTSQVGNSKADDWDATAQNVPAKLDLSLLLAQIRKWISGCDRYHPWCALPARQMLPKRVLDLSSADKSSIKLVELNGICAPYISLSYSWGPAGVTLKTTPENRSSHLRNIPWQEFPTVFQDAIVICWALKIQYLWVDALCIIQGDSADWEVESAKMAEIYSNSFLTIAAAACPDNHASLFSERWTSFHYGAEEPFKVPCGSVTVPLHGLSFQLKPKLQVAHNRFVQLENAHRHREDAPLLTRAWAFQERLLPSRTIHFHAEELVWECKTNMRCECGQLDDHYLKTAEHLNADHLEESPDSNSASWLKSLFASVEMTNMASDGACLIWLDLVSEFSRLDLTYEGDRLPALSGLAAKFLHCSMGDYFAGMWSQTLHLALLWESIWEEKSSTLPTGHSPLAPTWSWASVPLAGSNAISYNNVFNDHCKPSPDFTVLKLSGKVQGKNPFGWVKNGLLCVRGACVKCIAVAQPKGRWALKPRASRLTLSEHEDLLHIAVDGPNLILQNTKLVCLYLATGRGICLRKIARNPTRYRRVGLVFKLDWPAPGVWSLNDRSKISPWVRLFESKEVDII
jgi:hypothetical protein